jgi:hypothetical protein
MRAYNPGEEELELGDEDRCPHRIATAASSARSSCRPGGRWQDSTAGVSRGAKVHRRTEAQASIVAPPLAHMRLSNHRSLRMERPRFHTD